MHELLRTDRTASGRIEWFPAHPHEGVVSANGARSPPRSRRAEAPRPDVYFNLAVVLDGEVAPDGRPMGRAIAESTFHHFADYNWDLDRGAPSFVTEAPGNADQGRPVAPGDLQGLRPQHRDLAAARENLSMAV